MKKIPLSQGKAALVDQDDYGYLSQFKWKFSDGYAKRTVYLGGGRAKPRYKTVSMHRLLADCPNGKEVDHINGNGLDNRKKNLRVCTHAQNMKNQGIRKNNTTGVKGVCRKRNKFIANIWLKGKLKHLGTFEKKHDAAQARREAERKYHGEFARLDER